MLGEGLEIAIEEAEEDSDDGNLGDEAAVYVERAQGLASAIRDLEPGTALSVSLPPNKDELCDGLYGALRLQQFRVEQVSAHNDPPGPRFIEPEQFHALYNFVMAVEDLLEARSEERTIRPNGWRS